MKYAVLIEKTETGFSGYVPDLTGIGVAAATKAGVRRLLREAVSIYLEERRVQGARRSHSTTVAEYVEIS